MVCVSSTTVSSRALESTCNISAANFRQGPTLHGFARSGYAPTLEGNVASNWNFVALELRHTSPSCETDKRNLQLRAYPANHPENKPGWSIPLSVSHLAKGTVKLELRFSSAARCKNVQTEIDVDFRYVGDRSKAFTMVLKKTQERICLPILAVVDDSHQQNTK